MKTQRSTTLTLTLLVVVTAMILSACFPKATHLDEKDNGRQVTLPVGESLVISLPGNPTTGFTWEVKDLDATILEQVGETQFDSSNPGLVGAGGTLTLTYKAIQAGSTTLTLVYHRPWESDVEPLQTYTVQVTVQ